LEYKALCFLIGEKLAGSALKRMRLTLGIVALILVSYRFQRSAVAMQQLRALE
jgi:hypothetical protein